MKNKKAQQGPGILVTLISVVLVLAIIVVAYVGFVKYSSTRSNIDAINTWVKLRAASGTIDAVVSDKPPVINIESPLEIKSEEQLQFSAGNPPKAYKEIADSMVDCWNAFDRGKTDFIKAMGRETFCFPCRAVVFDEKIKKENAKIVGFERYLNEKNTRGQNSPTYMQYLVNDNAYELEQDELQEDEIIIDDDLYIFFFAASGRGWVNILTNVVAGEDLEEEPVVSGRGITRTGTADIEAIGAGTVAGTAVTAKALPALHAKFASVKVADDALVKSVEASLSQGGARVIDLEVVAASEKAAKKTVGKSIAKMLASKGVKFLAGKVFLPLTIASSAVGTYKVLFGDRPFSAKVMIVDPKQVHEICNA